MSLWDSLSGIVIGSLVAGPLVAAAGVTATFVVAGGCVAVASGLLLRHPLRTGAAPSVVVAAPAM